MLIKRIQVGSNSSSLMRLAADELARYTNALYRYRPRVTRQSGQARGMTLALTISRTGLSKQGYIFRRIDRNTLAIVGGSPIAVLWAVYDLVEQWGVRYELHGDVFPDKPAPMAFPDSSSPCEPTLPLRCFRTYNVLTNNTCTWPAEDYRVLIDQLTKLRFNAIMICSRPADPFVDLRFHGVRKSIAAPNFGWLPRIRPDHPGHDQMVASGDAARGVFANPDLLPDVPYAQTIAAGQRYARKIFRMAHARSMNCLVVAPIADFDPAIRRKLCALTKPKHKVNPSPMVRLRYGAYQEGGDVETGRCMTAKNPVFLDLLSTNMQAHIDAFPDADAFFFTSTEFGGSGADFSQAWKTLDKKYSLSNIATLGKIEREARENAEDDPDRSERELRSDIVILNVLDKLINERGLDMRRARRGATVGPGGLAAELHQFLPRIVPHGSMFFANYGYMPGHVATRTDTLRLDDPQSVRFLLTVSAEDDNIGLLPQMTGPSVHKIFRALQKVGAAGFLTRQWQHSNLLPTFHYMAHAAWDKHWTPVSAYHHLFGSICGPRATEAAVKALKRIERITTHLHENTICISFRVPNWITRFWKSWPESLPPAFLDKIARVYEKASDELVVAGRASRPAGRDILHALERHTRHGQFYCASLAALGRAREAQDVSDQVLANTDKEFGSDEWPAGGFDRLDASQKAVQSHTHDAQHLMRRCCETFAEGVRDRNDLAALATLNSYNLDIVSAIADSAWAASEMYSCVDP